MLRHIARRAAAAPVPLPCPAPSTSTTVIASAAKRRNRTFSSSSRKGKDVEPSVPSASSSAPLLEISTLANGVKVATDATPGHFVAAGVYVGAGSRFEWEGNSGSSHMMDRLAFKVSRLRMWLPKGSFYADELSFAFWASSVDKASDCRASDN